MTVPLEHTNVALRLDPEDPYRQQPSPYCEQCQPSDDMSTYAT